MLRSARRWFALALVLLAGGWLVSSALVAWRLTRRERPCFEEGPPARDWGTVESVRLATSDGEELGAWFHPPESSRPLVVLLHGSGGARSGGCGPAGELVRDGYGVLAPTLRAYGDSSGGENDFGWSQRLDVIAAVGFLERRVPGAPIVVGGMSLGAAAAIFAAPELDERVAGYVLVAPYRDLATACWLRCELHLPPVLDRAAYLGLKLWSPLFLGIDHERVRPIDFVASFPEACSAVFLAGERDRVAPSADVRELAERCSGRTRFEIVAGVGHKGLWKGGRERYLACLREVLEEASRRAPP